MFGRIDCLGAGSAALLGLVVGIPSSLLAEDAATLRSVLKVKDSVANSESEMKPYSEVIEHSGVKIDMLPIPSGKFTMGSPETETGRNADESPTHEVNLSPFWMGKYEITWDAYDIWMSDLDVFNRDVNQIQENDRDRLADKYQKSQPTKPYCDMSFGMGTRGFPATCMTQHSARTFCKWLSAKTGRYYRLPTEAEWEYACRAGTKTAYSFGDDPAELGNYAWFADNSQDKYQKVGRKKPNPWGLYDMHGNAAEWVLDQHDPAGYLLDKLPSMNPLMVPMTLYPRVVRGGGWGSTPLQCRSASREGSTEDWIAQDPQFPVSIWYLTDALHVGFRLVRPLEEPSQEDKDKFWEYSEPIQKERDVPLER
jgi:formylglycine-generating enzyme required for sulfatase activity